MVDYAIAIPSYHRADTLPVKTLALLKRLGADLGRVTVFVADGHEEANYRATCPGLRIVVGEPGMRAIRNFIQSYYPEGTPVLNLDDDLQDLHRRLNPTTSVPLKDWDWVPNAFQAAKNEGASLWGIYPIVNPLFMKNTVTTDLRYIIGALWGLWNTHDPATYVTLDDKEDFERTLKFYLKDGKVLRVNYLGIKSNYYGEAGGMQVERTPERVTASGITLLQRYPELCRVNKARKDHFEIALKDRRKRA